MPEHRDSNVSRNRISVSRFPPPQGPADTETHFLPRSATCNPPARRPQHRVLLVQRRNCASRRGRRGALLRGPRSSRVASAQHPMPLTVASRHIASTVGPPGPEHPPRGLEYRYREPQPRRAPVRSGRPVVRVCAAASGHCRRRPRSAPRRSRSSRRTWPRPRRRGRRSTRPRTTSGSRESSKSWSTRGRTSRWTPPSRVSGGSGAHRRPAGPETAVNAMFFRCGSLHGRSAVSCNCEPQTPQEREAVFVHRAAAT